MKQQINIRASQATANKLQRLTKMTNMTQTEVISIAVERMYKEEKMSVDIALKELLSAYDYSFQWTGKEWFFVSKDPTSAFYMEERHQASNLYEAISASIHFLLDYIWGDIYEGAVFSWDDTMGSDISPEKFLNEYGLDHEKIVEFLEANLSLTNVELEFLAYQCEVYLNDLLREEV